MCDFCEMCSKPMLCVKEEIMSMKVNSRSVVHAGVAGVVDYVDYNVASKRMCDYRKLDGLLPKEEFEYSPSRSISAKRISVLSQKSLLAYRKFKKTGTLPNDVSVTSALDLLAHASINCNEKLRLLAYEVILNGVNEHKEAVCDLCLLLGLGISRYAETMGFIPEDVRANLRNKLSQQNSSTLAQHLTLRDEEWMNINAAIRRRFESQDNSGLGPIRCYDVPSYMANYCRPNIGLLYRTLACQTPLVLQVLEEKDVHILSLYAEFLRDNKFSPKSVTDFGDDFRMSFNELTISQTLFDSSGGLRGLVSKLQTQNSDLKVTFVEDVHAERPATAVVYPFSAVA